MSKYKEFEEYTEKVLEKMLKEVYHLTAKTLVIEGIGEVLECYLSNVKPKDCAAKLLGKEV